MHLSSFLPWLAVAAMLLVAAASFIVRLPAANPSTRLLLRSLVVLAATVAGLVVLDAGNPFSASFPANPPADRWAARVLGVFWYGAAASAAAALLKLILQHSGFGQTQQPQTRKLFANLAVALVYFGGALAAASVVLEVPATGLVATSGVVAIITGLALQNVLADFFSGLALNIERPFRAGDWISIDADTEGRVMETNWRATHLQTRTGDILIVPNALIARGRLANRSRPSTMHIGILDLVLDAGVSPDRAATLLGNAARAANGVLAEPAPLAIAIGFGGGGMRYRVAFFIDDYGRLPIIRGQVATRIWHALAWADIRLVATEFVPAPTPVQTDDPAVKHLERVGLFSSMRSDELGALAKAAAQRSLRAGDELVRQGDQGTSMFLITDGVLEVEHQRDDGSRTSLGRLGAGDYVGEMSLLTGAVRSATVRATTPAAALEFTNVSLAPILTARPAVAEALAQIVSRRQAQLERETSGPAPSAEGETVLQTIRRFFQLSL
jgi:small-conductance mechanosensitive channel/CRP-like cAMP-binding protein